MFKVTLKILMLTKAVNKKELITKKTFIQQQQIMENLKKQSYVKNVQESLNFLLNSDFMLMRIIIIMNGCVWIVVRGIGIFTSVKEILIALCVQRNFMVKMDSLGIFTQNILMLKFHHIYHKC